MTASELIALADRLKAECEVRENHPDDYCPDLTAMFRECETAIRLASSPSNEAMRVALEIARDVQRKASLIAVGCPKNDPEHLRWLHHSYGADEVAYKIDKAIDNQPGRTAIIEITIDPPTLPVGTKLYAEPKMIAASEAKSQEPVAWQWNSLGTWHTVDKTDVEDPEQYARSFHNCAVRPIYLHPTKPEAPAVGVDALAEIIKDKIEVDIDFEYADATINAVPAATAIAALIAGDR